MNPNASPHFEAPLWAWLALFFGAGAAIAVDLRSAQKPEGTRLLTAWRRTLIWVGVAIAVAAALWLGAGPDQAQQYCSGYLIEMSLSVDNVFVFVVIFGQLGIAGEQQRRVLFWGVVGAAMIRTVFIAAGITLMTHATWLIEAFGVLLVATGIRLFTTRNRRHGGSHPSGSLAAKLGSWLSTDLDPNPTHFLVRRQGRLKATSLLIALLTVEAADFIFALDSLPAVLGVTRDAFTAVASNLLAILGLRSLYFVVGSSVNQFRHLSTSLSIILVFVGVKMLCAHWFTISTPVSLGMIALVLASGVLVSLARPENERTSS